MKKKKPTYEELESRLTQAEEAIRAIRSGEIDVIVGEKCPFIIKAKEMAEALKDSEERYRTLVENSIVGILIVVGPPPKIVFANIPFAKKMGYAVDELLAMTPYEIYELVHPDDREKFFERFADRITGKVPPSQYEVRGIRKDKRLIWGEVYSTLIKYQGKDALQVSFIDITERKLAEESLRLSEERFRQFFENAPVYCYMVSPEGIILNVNNAIISVLGYEKEELIGKPFTTIYAPEYHSKAMKNLETWRTTRRLDEVEMEIISKKGERRLGILSADVVIDKDGKVIHSISILRDITEHKKAVDRLKESEERYRTAIENSNDGVSMVKDGFHLYVNKKFLDIFGYTNADEIIGRSISITIHPDDRDRVMEISLKRQRGEDVPSRYEFKGIKKDGEVVHIEVSVARTTYCGETVSLAYLRDISERKKREEEIALLQEQLRQAQKMEAIGRLAGGVAHDFNNILSVINGTAQLLLLDLREGDPLYTNLKEIEKASDRAADLTRQLLAFSRKQVMEMRVLDLNTVVRNLEKMLRRIIGEDIELVTYLSEGLWRVKVDPSQVEQAIINIVVNARDAMPDGGKLTIETENVELDGRA
ncbi:MAG: PAS domain S-box protein [Thermodesulfobacteriota bacterium]